MTKYMMILVALALTATMAYGGEVLVGGTNYVLGQGIEPPGLIFGLESVAFEGNGEIDMKPYALESTLGDVEKFEFRVTDPHAAGWTWVRMEYLNGADWVPLVSFVLDDQNEDAYMTHAEWPVDGGYVDGWGAWGAGSLGMSVKQVDTDGDGMPDGWEVYQVDENGNSAPVHTYSWASLPDSTGPDKLSLDENTPIRFY